MNGLAKLAEFREDHWQPKEKKTNKKKELAEDVAIGSLGAKGGSIIGGLAGAAAGKKTPLENPASIDVVKTRTARKVLNGALHNRQARMSTIKGGAIGAGVGLGLAGLGIAYKHEKSQEKIAATQPENPDLPREHNTHHLFNKDTLNLVERTANPATRREVISELFSSNQLHRYENIPHIPLRFGSKGELDLLKPKKHTHFDTTHKDGPYHPIMQGAKKHWAETGRGFHARKS